MRKSRKNRFDWYSVSQRFSIRKYHIGAVSVLLGSCLLLNGIQAAAETQVAENTQPQVELVTEASPGGAVKAARQVTFTYKVVFVDSNGLTIKEDTLTHSISTTEEKATYSHTLSNLLLPEGYSLASNQDNKLTVTLLEGEVPTVYLNLDVLQVVEEEVVEETPVAPPAEEAGTKEEQATEKVEESTLETAEEVKPEEKVVAEVPQAPANETVRAAVVPTEPTNPVAQPIVPTSVDEAKHVLEQVTSEAEVLSSQAERLVATSDQENEALKTVAAATKLTATEATVTLNDSKATLEIVNAKIDAVRTNVEALVLELRKFLGTDVIEIALNTTVTNLNVGQGEGVLVETGTTATPSMDDAHGAGIQPHSLRNGIAATTKSGWYTVDSYDLESYNRNQGGTVINGARVEAYMRFSYDSNPNTHTVLAELVSTADGQVLEFHEVSPDGVVEFNYPKTVHANNHKIVLSYRTETAIDGSTYGLVKFSGDNGTVYNNTILPVYQVNTTRYEVKDGRTLATYSLQTIAGQPVTSSGQREFAGFEFVEKKVKSVQGGYPVGSVYVAGVVNNGSNNYKVIRTIVANNAYKHEVFVKDPTYTGTVNYNSLDTTGFFKLVETSGMTYTPDGKSYDYNINSTIYADYTEDPATGLMVFKESAPNSKGSKYRVVAQWSGTGEQGTYGRIYIGTQVWSTTTDKTTDWQWIGTSGKFHNKDYVPAGDQQTLRGAGRPTAVETTYIYRALEQEAIVRYKVEGETTYLEESDILTGGSGSEINYSTEATINKYKKLGYELVSDNFTTDAGQNYDYDTAVRQEFLVVIKPRLVEVPKDVVPGEPVDPEDPNTPKWPNSTGNLERTQEVTRIVAYKYEDGTPVRVDDAGNILPKDSTEGTPLVKTQTVTFSRTATVNLVTGDITYGEWTADSTNVLNGNLIPEITDYSATRTTLEGADAPMTESVNDKTVIATSADINEVVFYTPNPKYGDVVVKYVDTAGTEIATPVVDTNDALVGTDYNTAEDNKPDKIIDKKTGDVYYILPEGSEIQAGSAAETGKVVEGTTEVTYKYQKAGNVKINYILDDAAGTTLKDSVMDEENAKPGTAYDTTDEGDKPETISKDGKLYRLKEVKADSAAENGDTAKIVAGETLEVTYVYTEVKSDVIVKYYDTEGNLIAGTETNSQNTVTDTDDKSVGTLYNTDEDHRPETITSGDKVYYYKQVKDGSASPVGTVAATDTTVEYVYELAGSVNVNYVDVDGNKLSGTDGAGKVVAEKVADTVNAKAGTDYDTIVDNRPTKIVTADGKTYELAPAAEYTVGTVEADHHLSVSNVTEVTGIHEAIGSVTSGITKEITFVYKEVTGKVVVNFKSTSGEPLQDQRTDTKEGSTGRDYNTEEEGEVPPTITKEGKTYKLVPNLTKGNPTGEVTPGTTEVTYYYQLVTGDVVVNYENTDGKTIAPQKVDVNNGNIGDAYDTRDEGDKPEKIVEEGTGDVYYIKPAGTEVKVGDGLSGETGQVVEGTTQVTYIYEKAGNVKINYILDDADGTTLKDSVMDEENAKPGTAYDTTDEGDKPKTISKDGKLYRLKEVKADSAAENGDTAKIVAGETLEVTYVYTEVKSDVVVEYYDTEGNLLTGKTNTGGNVAQRVTDTRQASVGTPYNTDEDHRPATITTADETIYHYVELKEGSAQPEGTVAETTTTVQYVYAKAGSVVIRYVKEDDKGIQSELQPNVLDEDNVKPGTPYDTTDEGNKPTTITTEDGKTYTLVRNEGHDETGEVAAGETKEITYVYKEVTGKVVVNFKSTSGETLQDQRTDTKEGSTGRDYNTEEDGEVPPTITKDGKLYRLVPNKKDGNPTGKVTPGTTEVTYYYEPVIGDVIIKYTDTEGNTLKDTVIDEDDVIVGTDYDTTNEGDKPEVITTSNGKYVLVPSLTTATDPTGTETTETGKVLEGTTTITYVYQKVANWIPLIPNVPENERPKTEYPFDPTEPDKEIPSIPTNPTTDKPVIPHVPGYTPVDPKDNTPLTPVDPEDPSKGYVPPTPETPGKDTLIPYVPVKGDVVIKYVDTEGNTLKDSVTDEDDVLAGTKYDTTDEGDKPTEIVRNGDKYVLVPSKTTAVDPADKPVKETGNVVEGTTTITYVYQKVANWIPLIPNVPENERPKTEYPFDPTEPDKEIPSIPTNPTTDKPVIPHVPGYTPVDPKDNTPLTPVDPEDPSKGYVPPTPETPGEDTLIPYVPVKGDVVIKYVDTDGNTLKDSVTDEDDVLAGTKYDTTDEGDKPTEIVRNGDKYVLVPSKTTAVDPTGTDTTETGKVLEGTTTITYVYQKVANWIPEIPGVPENERPKTEYPFDPTEPGKEIPSIPTNPTTDKPVIPHVPGYTPVDPKDNTPLTPVDPEDPSKGYVPPTPETPGEDTLIPYVPVKGDVVINYVDTDGNILKSPVTDEYDVLAGTKYDTTDEGDKPTEIVRNGDKYVLVPSKTTAVDPTGTDTTETGKVLEGTTTITYVYQKVANWIPLIPNVPENERPKTEYPFDPTEPDKEIPSIPTNPTTDKPVIPHVPGYTPVDPKDNTPLTPVDPEDPSKGYIPPTPETPGEDTLIPYVPVKGDVVINYVDTDGNILKSPVTDEDDVLAGTKYDTTDEGDKPTEIVRNGDKYVLVPSKTTAVDPAGKSVEETGSVVEGTTTITYVYQKVANWIPLIPNVPENERPKTEYPFDPTEPNKEIPSIPTNPTTDKPVIPHVPGYTPVDPKDNTPLTPVDPEDPSKGYIPPTPETPGEDTLIPYVPVKGDVVIKYVDTDGNTLKDSVTDEDDVLAGTKYDTTDEGDKPTEIVRNGDKYVLVPSKTTAVDPAGKSVEETGSVVEGTTTITYVYQKVANWIPLIPNVPENERPKTEYPFDPTEPDKEIPSIPTNPTTDKPVIPHVPGYTPVDPKDNTPLTPVDPEDPSKGYIPPTPETPGEDTLIPYVPVKGDVVIKYVDTDGNTLKDTVTDEDDVLAGTKYDTTDEGDKPTEIVRNGDKYVLVPSKTTAVAPAGKSVEETGSVVEGITTITYVYQKVANWIPLIPNVPENELPKTEYPFDPTEPDKEIPSIPTNPTTDKPVIPHVPGYTPVDPKDNTPLTPVDPEDPSKGYIPPTPETPGEDTLIPYVPVKQGSVIVAYITEDGVEIKSPVTDTPTSPEGTPYDTTDNKPKTITYNGEEYELVRVDGTENGKVVEGDTKVTYVYRKKPTTPPVTPEVKQGTVVVTYITEDGVEIKSPVTDTPTSPEGTPYDTTDNKPTTITYNGEEYELVRVEGTENGTVVEGDTKVTYVYRKKPTTPPVTPEVKQGTVVVNYITEDGVEIKSPVTDTPNSPEGTPYDTTDNKPKTITYNGEEYELVRVDGTENGKVVEGDTKVTYVYRKKPTTPPVTPEVKQGTVVVTYITEDGVEIKSPVTDTPTSPEGTPYDTTDNKPKTITYNGEEYELVRVDGTENGTVVEGDTKVTYVYRKKPTTPPVTPEVKQGTVVVTYITEDGVEIKSPVTDTPTSPEGTPYDTTDNKPKTITYNGEEYELVRVDGTENGTVVEGNTKVTYVYRKVVKPTPPAPAKPSVAKPVKSEKPKLPDTGEEESTAGMLGVLLLVSSLFGVRKRRRDQE